MDWVEQTEGLTLCMEQDQNRFHRDFRLWYTYPEVPQRARSQGYTCELLQSLVGLLIPGLPMCSPSNEIMTMRGVLYLSLIHI